MVNMKVVDAMLVTVSREAAANFILNQSGLGPLAKQPGSLLEQIQQLEAVQIDPVARVGRNQDLVLLARDGQYQPDQLDRLLSESRVFEYRCQEASVLPMRDYPLFKGVRQRIRERLAPEMMRYQDIVDQVLATIDRLGPQPSRAFLTSTKVMGYWDTDQPSTKATSHVLALLKDAGDLMVVKREGVVRYFDRPERVVPPEIWQAHQDIDVEEADEALFDKYLRAYRLIRGTHNRLGWSGLPMAHRRQQLKRRLQQKEVLLVGIEGVKAPYYILAKDYDDLMQAGPPFDPCIRFLPPLDNLLWDRTRLMDLWQFPFRWEVYVPKAKREFGVYAMPILLGNRLVGRIDPALDRKQRRLLVHGLAFEGDVTHQGGLVERVVQAVNRWAQRLGADQVIWALSFELQADGSQPDDPHE